MRRNGERLPKSLSWAWLGLAWLWLPAVSGAADPEELRLPPGARVAIVGDGLALGMARHGYLETALHLAFPSSGLSVRSFAWDGFRVDEAGIALDGEIDAFDPDLILLCSGFNESFDGPERVADFGKVLRTRCEAWGQPHASQKKSVTIELIPPVPYLQHYPGMPDEVVANQRLAPYVEEMRAVAGESDRVGCLDLSPVFTDLAFELSGDVSRDGRRLNRRGHWLLATLTASRLGLPQGQNGLDDPAMAENLRQLVMRKELAWSNSGRQGGERGRGWDQALWSMDKSGLSSLWAVEPGGSEVCPEAPQSLGMPVTAQFGLANRMTPGESLQGMKLAEGLSIGLWASETGLELWNPLSLRFDGEGRAWVGCAPPGLDPCLIRIEDIDGDHAGDRQSVVVSGRIDPEGFIPAPGGVYVSTEAGLVWYADEDEDGAADHWETVLGGSGKRQGLRWGPTGGIWFREQPTTSDSVETPWGPKARGQGGLVHWNPRIGRIEMGVRSGQDEIGEICFDRWGVPLVEMGHDGQPIALDWVGAWKEAPPARLESDTFPGEAGPWIPIDGEPWPKPLRGASLRAERAAGGRWELAVYQGEWDGSVRRWRRQESPVLACSDANFHPVAIESGPDGALYVLDAYGRDNPLRAGSWGRIWRIAPARWPPSWDVPADVEQTAGLLEELQQGGAERGGGVRLALWHRPAGEVFTALGEYLNGLAADDPARQRMLLEALRLHQAFGEPNPDLLARLTESPDPAVRHASADVLGDWYSGVPGAAGLLQRLMEDENPRVRLAALHCARRAGTPEAGGVARLARHQRMDDALRAVAEGTVSELGGPDQSPPSLRAKAIATATADLIAGEMTPYAASVLLERSGVENSVLRQAAAVLAGRAGLSFERWFVERLEDRSSPDILIGNLVKLLPLMEGWELYQAGGRLQGIAEGTERGSLRRAAYAALTTGAAASLTLESLVATVSAQGDYEAAGLFEGCAQVISHPKVRAAIGPIIRSELAGEGAYLRKPCTRVRLVAPGWEVFHFAELEAFAGGRQVALGRATSQSESPNGMRWWSTLSKNGVNGVADWQEELPLKDLVPGTAAVRGVKVAGGRNSGPYWEVNLGDLVQLDRLVYHPGEPLPTPRPLRFELLNGTGETVWSSTRFTSNGEPLVIDVDMSEQRIAAATAVARLLGDDFRRSLETVARHSALLPARFNALRALQLLGGEPSGLRMRTFVLAARPDGFTVRSITVHARDAVELTLHNETSRDLNLGLFEQGPTAAIPVLTLGTVPVGDQVRCPFSVPSKPGRYLVRSIEESGSDSMRIELEVTAPEPEPSASKK